MHLQGIGIGGGVVVGRIVRMPDPLPEPVATPSALTPAVEGNRVAEALGAVAADLLARAERAGGVAGEVLEAQSMMAEDPTLVDDVTLRLAAGATAERAVFEAFTAFRDMLIELGGYMAERAGDLTDISQRVIARLSGVSAPGVPDPGHPFILVARDLAPADTATLDLGQVLGLITLDGGPTSHTAILAREKSIVALVGAAGAASLCDGDEVILDAANSVVVTSPSAEQRAEARAREAARAARALAPVSPGRLADGTPIPLLANLGSADGAEAAVALGAEGVGLFRTEFLFLDAVNAPTVTQQRVEYERMLRAFPGKKVVVRALDAGADKPLAFLNDAREENPALGLRGLRALRASEQILRDQLAALAQADAATDAELWVMAPMVATVEETRYFVGLARELGLRTAGVMVEIPSAALLADRILRHADFASIGTNDLTQYTLAADRMLGSVAGFQDPWNPAVLRLVADVGAAGAALGKPVGVCGEAAADPLLAVVLVGLGVTSLSMSASALADVRAALGDVTRDQARMLAELALAADDAVSARALVTTRAADLLSSPSPTEPSLAAPQERHPRKVLK
ncbi:phosphoenolpyruvate-protein phosphotransferase [Cryobacterium sp. MLB-32]|uniref:phosphoenolpyruvate--protein phosphotransferase n=1 Tax=Cryobacterium sp. MLB-32 TaxID=1529318 RepID=UPI0004E77DC1|nr:phosphoenolpyruvate--protein phosphotransferase [Cryobacterium sp. MLB-32]KFF58679.1 phosphoenolpyruvate-protein phosphotransferase [Cryobacterium sp. MLB-32]